MAICGEGCDEVYDVFSRKRALKFKTMMVVIVRMLKMALTIATTMTCTFNARNISKTNSMYLHTT